MEDDILKNLRDRSHVLEEKDDPFEGLYSNRPPSGYEAPTPPRRPAELAGRPTAPAAVRAGSSGLEWSDVPGEALKNAGPSALNMAKSMIQPIRHPIDTATTFKDIGAGVLSKARGAIGYEQDPKQKEKDEATVNAMRDFYIQRYGSEEGFKKALAEDPFGVAADASAFIGGGGAALARAPGLLGKAGEVVQATGRAIHPASVAATVGSPLLAGAQVAANIPLHFKSGAPFGVLNNALGAGWRGSEEFLYQMRGSANPEHIVERAHGAVKELENMRRESYLKSKEGMEANKAIIGYKDIYDALRKERKKWMFGTAERHEGANRVLDEIGNKITGWQRNVNTPEYNYHGVAGLDALKQKIGEVMSRFPEGTQEHAAAKSVYTSVRDIIANHDPNYLAAMGDYSDASNTLRQLKTTLSVNPKASTDTTLRKLLLAQKQKDGSKATLLQELADVDPAISDMISGHLLHSLTPTGLSGQIGAALTVGPHAVGAGIDPMSFAANVATSSPRLAGELNYAVGRAAHPAGGLPLMTTMPGAILEAARDKEQPRHKSPERPYFPGKEEERPGRATGGRATGPSADRLISMAIASRKKIQNMSKEILKQPDEHVVSALKVANENMQG